MKIYSGRQAEFWFDIWVGFYVLSASFPLLFQFSLNKHFNVEELLGFLRTRVMNLASASHGYSTRSLCVAERAELQ